MRERGERKKRERERQGQRQKESCQPGSQRHWPSDALKVSEKSGETEWKDAGFLPLLSDRV